MNRNEWVWFNQKLAENNDIANEQNIQVNRLGACYNIRVKLISSFQQDVNVMEFMNFNKKTDFERDCYISKFDCFFPLTAK